MDILVIITIVWYALASLSKSRAGAVVRLWLVVSLLNAAVWPAAAMLAALQNDLFPIIYVISVDALLLAAVLVFRTYMFKLLSIVLTLHIINHGFIPAPYYDSINSWLIFCEMVIFIGAVKDGIYRLFNAILIFASRRNIHASNSVRYLGGVRKSAMDHKEVQS